MDVQELLDYANEGFCFDIGPDYCDIYFLGDIGNYVAVSRLETKALNPEHIALAIEAYKETNKESNQLNVKLTDEYDEFEEDDIHPDIVEIMRRYESEFEEDYVESIRRKGRGEE